MFYFMRKNSFVTRVLATLVGCLALVAGSARANVTASVQPAGQVVLVGANVTLTGLVAATAGETVTGYSWRFSTNTNGPFAALPGATSSVLNFPSIQATNSGYYILALTYNSGTNLGVPLVSAVAVVTVHDQARIVSQPQSLSRIAGMTANFNVGALGLSPLAYQWQLNGTNLTDDGRISGSQTAALSIPNLVGADAGNYTVIVSNQYAVAISQVANLAVLVPPSIAAVTGPLSVILGSNATFSVTAAGDSPFAYQWQFNGTNLHDGARISGSQTATLGLAAARLADAGGYSVIVTNPVGSITSSAATLSVLTAPKFTSTNSLVGKQGYAVSFPVTASGSAPITFTATNLPTGLSLDPVSGLLTGIPAVFGVSNVILAATLSFPTNQSLTVTSALTIRLASDVPGITSSLTNHGKQGVALAYSIVASNTPTDFTATGLPTGLSVNPTNGLISGTPIVYGTFPVQITASNLYGGDSQTLLMGIDCSIPVINSPLTAAGVQGQVFNYQITASNPAITFAAAGLPPGINLNTNSGLISGPPIGSGTFPVAITVFNAFGSDTTNLTLNLAGTVPVLTCPFTTTGMEGSNFLFTITATNTLSLPTVFSATGLPLGLYLAADGSNIMGAPLYGGTFNVLLAATDAYGAATNNLVMNIAYATNAVLYIDTNSVTYAYSPPYLLDFMFSLATDADPTVGDAVVRPPDQFQVTALEDTVATPTATNPILLRGNKKQFKGFLVLDYTYNMFSVDGAISNMQYSAEQLINEEALTAQFGVYEFNADYSSPILVTNFTSDKRVLAGAIEGIQTNLVQGNYAGSRAFDAIYGALGQFSGTNIDEARYLIVMTDGNDDSSLINTNSTPLTTIVTLAQKNNVRIYCVGFGNNVNTNALQMLTSQTAGRYYLAATTADLPVQFARIFKDIDGQYILRWATLRRAPVAFQPGFQLTLDGATASFNSSFVMQTNFMVVTNPVGSTNIMTNMSVTNLTAVPLYNPTNYAGNVLAGQMRLVPDSAVGPKVVRLRASYVPRYIRQIRVNYRANYPAVVNLESDDLGDFFRGWSLSQTNDGAGGQWLTMTSPNPANQLTSLPYGVMGDLLTFQFHDPEQLTTNAVFSAFTVDNSIYTNILPAGLTFTLSNAPSFITKYPAPPPHGTPIPWLVAYGYTTNFAAAELLSPNGNGLAVWQDYLAGLNPTNTASQFAVQPLPTPTPGVPGQITFGTVAGRTYRVDTATALGQWTVLQDYIAGTGANVTIQDNRDLRGLSQVFYRVAVY